jgi:hypothetical protein
MSLKTFLQEKGFIEKENAEIKKENVTSGQVAPTYFPLNDINPSFVKPATNSTPVSTVETIDPAFIKFFEDELLRLNFSGPDYFEFRKQMNAMYQKIGSKGTPPEIILQAVLTSFEAMNISSSTIVDTARQYKEALDKKKTEFLKGANAEKDKQLKKRQDTLQSHQDNLNQMQTQLLQLQNQMNQLQDMIKREQTQLEVNKTLGKEGIEKIERAEQQMAMAFEFIVKSIDADIKQLQSV